MFETNRLSRGDFDYVASSPFNQSGQHLHSAATVPGFQPPLTKLYPCDRAGTA